ncbi:cytidylyltransferase domain-containing protein [Vreelandella sulfidaeris]|uniref:acylneuraminate cytidylyltransferase family protein n=1 Tax=Vreelandella sulfidaeris TaxID=115553 RepID=UPI0019D46518|nr:acylneuraminate cytidylyltransferase family protein [Halomonas sulfidaeris]
MTKALKTIDIVAIVPARGGSKRLPRKNVLPLAGKPLIQWTLDAAKESGAIDLIVVTSDDEEVLAIAEQNQVMAIRRPDYLSTDTATSVDAVIHALDALEAQNIVAKRVMLLQPTSPLRRAEDIRKAVKRMDDCGAASVISVCEMDHSPLWSNTLPEDGRMDDFIRPEVKEKRSQDLPLYYRLNGSIYLIATNMFRQNKSFFVTPCNSVVMEKGLSQDIDDKNDFLLAEFMLSSIVF